MLATALLALLFLLPSASPGVTHVSPGVHAVEVADQVREVVDLSPEAARAYHVVRPDGASLAYKVRVLEGGAIDVYLMPAPVFEAYASGGPGGYIDGFSEQATRGLRRTFNGGGYLDTYLVVDNLDGPTGASPTGNVTVEVALALLDPGAGRALVSEASAGAVALALVVTPPLVRRYIALAGGRSPPPPPEGEGAGGPEPLGRRLNSP